MKRNVTIAQDRLAGATYQELADQHEVSKTTIFRILNDDEIRDVLKQGTNELVSMVPLAIDNYHTFLTDKSHPDHYKASKDALQNTGVLGSHTGGNTYIDKILVVGDQGQAKEVPRIQDALAALQAIDIECTEVSGSLEDDS